MKDSSKSWTTQPKIAQIWGNSKGTVRLIPGRKFSNILVYLQGNPLFLNLGKKLFNFMFEKPRCNLYIVSWTILCFALKHKVVVEYRRYNVSTGLWITNLTGFVWLGTQLPGCRIRPKPCWVLSSEPLPRTEFPLKRSWTVSRQLPLPSSENRRFHRATHAMTKKTVSRFYIYQFSLQIYK